MKVEELMTRDVVTAAPEQTIQQAARAMCDLDIGVLPVGQGDRLVGMLTDRDIAVRAVAFGKGPETRVGEVMSREIKYCFCDEEVMDVSSNMADIQLRRLPVVDRDKRLVGILTLADIATSDQQNDASVALSGISRPGSDGLGLFA
jgi:CBS domain-containing protein